MPVSGPSDLTAIKGPSAGPSNLDAIVLAPASGPSGLAATVLAPASGPSDLSAAEAIPLPLSGPSGLAATVIAPASGPSDLDASILAPVSGPSDLTAALLTLNIAPISSDQDFVDTAGSDGDIIYAEDIGYIFIYDANEGVWHRTNGKTD